MKIEILFDKSSKDEKLRTGWGVSFLIGGKVLFDTGENGGWLIENMEKLRVDIDKIEAVVISHDHWDHTGGLWEVLKKRTGVRVYACPNFSAGFKDKVLGLKGKLIEDKGITEVSKNVFITGEIEGEYKGGYMPEQAIVVKTERGLTVATGCAHPGIAKIAEAVRDGFFPERIYLIFGGFHLKDAPEREIKTVAGKFKEIAVEKAGPTHCSGAAAERVFRKVYGDNFISVKVGGTLNI